MANSDENVYVRFHGDAKGLTTAAQQASQAVNSVASATKTMTATTVTQGVVMANVLTQIGQRAVSMAKNTVTSFSSLTAEVRKMQSIMGGTAEDVSKLRFAGEELGVSANTISRAYRFLSTHLTNNDKVAQKLGVAYKNLDGSMRSPVEVMGEVADKLNELPIGAERSALGAKLFSRGFFELNPLLKAGSKGFKDLAKEAEQFGLIVSEKDLEATKQFKMASDALSDGLRGLVVDIGSAVMPTLAALAQSYENGVKNVRAFFTENKTAQTVLKVIAGALVVAASALLIYKTILIATATWTKIATAAQAVWTGVTVLAIGVTEGLTGAMTALNLVLNLNPAVAIATGVMLLVAALIVGLKTSDKFREVFVNVMGWIGNVAGKAIAVVVQTLKALGIAFINVARIVVKAGEIITGNRVWKTLFGGGANKSIKGALDALDSFEAKFVEVANSVAGKAWNKGTDIGRGLGKGIADFIKNLKLPSFKMPEVKDPKGGGIEPDGDTGADSAALDKLKAYWQKRIDIAKEAYNTAQGVARDAAKSLTSGFDVTEIAKTSFAKYLGAGAMVDLFKKKLADAKEFVADIKTLKAMGLPLPMLQQLVAAGVDGGLDAARVLMSDTGAISQLQSIQGELDLAAADIGEVMSGAQGISVSTARAGLTSEITAARNAGMTVEETTSSTGDVNISVDVATNADPVDIADAVAFAIKTNTPVKTVPKRSKPKSRSVGRTSSAIGSGRFAGKVVPL